MLNYIDLYILVLGYEDNISFSLYDNEEKANERKLHIKKLGMPVILIKRKMLENSRRLHIVYLLTVFGGGDENIFVTTDENEAVEMSKTMYENYAGVLNTNIQNFRLRNDKQYTPPPPPPSPVKKGVDRIYRFYTTELRV